MGAVLGGGFAQHLLVNGLNIWKGVILCLAAYAAQIIVGFLLTKTLPSQDRWHIAFAQQNGITAIILALLFETYYPGTVAIVDPAIVVTNSIHAIANRVLDVYLSGEHHKLRPTHHLKRLRAHIHKV